MTLRSTNLNLLPVLRALLTEGSVTRASEVLGLSQPATSHALVRLRHLLGDPLLVQIGRTMRLTPRAETLSPRVDAVCAAIEALLTDDVFHPRDLRREFVIAAPDYIALLLGPVLTRDLVDAAPGVRAHFVDVPDQLRAQVIAGSLDMAVIAPLESVVRGLSIFTGYRDRLVGVAGADHPLIARPPKDQGDLAAHPKVGIRSGDAEPKSLDAIGRIMSSTGALSVSASQISLLAPLAVRTGQFAVVPRAAVGEVTATGPVAVFDLPGEPLFLDACMVWSPLQEAEPAHRWFRERLDAHLRLQFAKGPAACSAGPDELRPSDWSSAVGSIP